MRGFCARLHTHLARHRLLTAFAALALWGGAALLALHMRVNNSSATFFPDEVPEMARMAAAMDMAPFSRLLFVDISDTGTKRDRGECLAATADAVMAELPENLAVRAGRPVPPDPERLLALLPSLLDAQALQTLRGAAEPRTVDDALLNARRTLAGLWGAAAASWLRADPLHLKTLIFSRLPAPPSRALPDPALGYPLSRDGRHLLLVLRPRHSIHDVEHAVTLMDALRAALDRHLKPGMRALIVGGHRHTAANTNTIRADVQRIVLLSMLGFVATYLLLVRSLGAIWLLLTPLAAVSVASGGMALLWPVVSGLALGFGASVLGIAEDYAVHMHFALRNGEGTENVLDMLSVPLFQALLINASGFAVLLFSGIPAVRQLAAFALLTLAAGFLLAVTVLPLCPWFDRPLLRRSPSTPPLSPGEPAPRRVLSAAVVLFALCAGLFHLTQVDVSPRGLGADMAAMQADAEQLRTVWGDGEGENGRMLVMQGRSLAEVLARTREAVALLRQRDPGNRLDTLTDLLPAPETAQANRERWAEFASGPGRVLPRELAEAGGRYGFTPDAFAPFLRLLHEPPVPLTPETLRSAGLGDLVDTFLRQDEKDTQMLVLGRKPFDLSALPPELREHLTELSPERLESTLLGLLNREKLLLPTVWIVCCLLIYLCFRNIWQTLLAALPPLCSLACILGWMVLTGTSLNLAALAALPLVMGLATDHGVMVTHDLAHGKELGIHRAVLVSSLTALTGMGLLALAEHPALKAMGQVIFLGLLVEVPAALWLLPRLCRMLVLRKKHDEAVQSPGTGRL